MSLLFFKAFLFQLIYTTSISVATLLPPRVSTPQKTIYAKEGDTKIVLECQLDVGDHPVAYKWFKQYKWVTADFGHAYRTHKNVYLSLHALTPRHAGTYECEARNDAGVDAASIEVIVEPADDYYTVSGGENAEIPDTASVLSEFAASLNDVLAEGNCSCDVLFLLHASPDAPNETLAAQANFVHTLAHPIISRSLRVGVLTYSDYTVTKLPLGGANDACALKEAFKELNHEKWSTRIRPVLRDAEKKFKKSTSNCKVLFLPIFGSAGNELPNVIASKDLKKLGVEVFVLEVTDTPLPGVDQLASKRGDGRRHHWWIPLKVWTTLVSYMSYMPEELVGCAVNHEDIDGQCVGEGSNCTSSRQCRDPGFGCVDGACQTLQCNVRPDSSDCCGTEGEFWCGDITGSCEPRDHLCDGKLQCMNGRDEDDCWRTPCHEGDTRCQSSTLCLSPHDLCDGYPHCPAAEDEDPNFCRSFPCPVDKPFRCRDGKCISTELVCDGSFRDCSDGADEDLEYCSGQHVCPTSLPFKCDYGVCVPEKVVCDGAFNCLDALDERLCEERSCPPQRPFKCRHGQCVDVALVCNGVVDACSDGSDEENCTNFSCPNDRSFKCSNGRCIDKWLECDGRNDCGDGSDEDRCGREGSSSSSSSTISTTPSTMTLPPAPTKASCLPDEFFCSSGICLPESKLCDGRNNCINGEDESPEICVHRPCGSPGRVQCANGQCSEGRVCDGVVDCPDESDERDCAYLPEYERPVTDEGSNNNSTFSEGSEISHGTRDGGDDEAAEKQGDLETNLEDVSLSTGEETLSPSISGATNLLTSFRCFVLCFFTFAASRVCSRTLLNAQFPY